MYHLLREPDECRIEYGEGTGGAQVRFEKGNGLKIFVKADGCTLNFVRLRWREKTEGEVKILGDGWERLYGTAEWRGIVAERVMPWYLLVNCGAKTQGVGVKVRPNALCSWMLDCSGITLQLDLRSGSQGVRLGGRELLAAEVVSKSYTGVSPFAASRSFCEIMTDSPVLPKEPVYGSNNWYYAYGNSSHAEILSDSKFVAEMTPGLSNRPYMVIDDGWQPHMTAGPWDIGNERFPDMPRLVREMKETGVKPGVWIRALYDKSSFAKGHTLPDSDHTLDPTDPAVLNYVKETVERLKDWGMMLVKHDYSSVDISGTWGCDNRLAFVGDNRKFRDDSMTTAEITKRLYKTIYDAAGDMIVLGCNCVNHLCVGYVHLNRTGDDTSGVYWDRTRKMGVNALAFRLCQDERFFKVDADCVGLTANIPWSLNKQWLELLAKSGTPLFVSAQIRDVTDDMRDALKSAFALASIQKSDCEPLDWMYNSCPALWRFGNEIKRFAFDGEIGVEVD